MTLLPSPFRPAQTPRSHWYAVGFVAAYAVTAFIAYKWTVGPGGLAILWPCNGLLTAAFLLLRRRDALIAALICAAADGLAGYWLGHTGLPRSLLIAGCDLFEAFLAAVLMRRFCGAAVDVITIPRLMRMTLFAALPATMIVGTVGTLLYHVLFGDQIGPLWLTWAFGDMLGMMAGAPSALIIARFPRYLRDKAAGAGESLAIVLGLSFIAAGQLFLNGQNDAFLIFPFMLLAAFRISAPYSALAVAAISAITAVVTLDGHGPFAAAEGGSRVRLLSLQMFLACVTFSTLIAQGWLTSLSQVRRRAARALAAARQTAKQAQENTARHAEGESRYRILADNMTDVILRYDAEARVEYVSPSIRQLGYDVQEFLDLPPGDIVHPDDWPKVAVRRDAIFRGEQAGRLETRVRHKDGRWIWVESRPAPIRGGDGAVIGIVSALRDISGRKAAEQALIDSEARYRMLAENTKDIIQRLSVDYICEYMSPSIRQLGYEPDVFLGRQSMTIVHPDYREALLGRLADVLLGKPVPPLELRVFSASGEQHWLESDVSPIHDASGKVTGVVNVMRNITERKAAEAALRQVNSELQRVARVSALGAFATSLGHEINQPLAAIVTNSETAQRWLSRDPPDVKQALRAVERTGADAWRASQVIARLRALVTKEAPVKAEFDVKDAIREVLDLTESRRTQASVLVTQALGRSPRRIFGDRIQFQQVVMNLVLNAVEAMQDVPADGRRLVVSSRTLPGGAVEIAVEDNGPGISPELRQTIFNNLFTTKTGGTGLGLTISKSIVEAHGGALRVESADPRGAVFIARFPRADQNKGA